jgi:hypothetical protein
MTEKRDVKHFPVDQEEPTPQGDFTPPRAAPIPAVTQVHVPDLQNLAKEIIESSRANLKKGHVQREVPYWTVFAMNIFLFLAGMAALGVAIYRGLQGDAIGAGILGSLSTVQILAIFLLQPIEMLQRSNLLNSGLVCAINTYWIRVMFLRNVETIDRDLRDLASDAVAEFIRLGVSFVPADPPVDMGRSED